LRFGGTGHPSDLIHIGSEGVSKKPPGLNYIYVDPGLERKSVDIEHILDRAGNDLIAATVGFWKEHSGFDVTPDDAREMIENLSGFFMLLDRWDRNGPGA
jgi:hypothetical protein